MKAIGSFFKNFVVYNHDMDIDRDVMQHEVPALTDPNGQTWSTVGLVPVTDEGFIFHSLDGMGLLFCVQFNERILPAKVRDEHFRKTLDAIEQREGRKPTKKEYAELRDEAERDLLPQGLKDEMFDYYLAFLLSGIIGIYRTWALSDGSVPIERVSEVANDLTLNGLSSLESRLD